MNPDLLTLPPFAVKFSFNPSPTASCNPLRITPFPLEILSPHSLHPHFFSCPQALANSDPSWVRVNQDEAGGRRVVEAQLGRVGREGGRRVILDRCNPQPEDRKAMMALAMLPRSARTSCVHFEARDVWVESGVAWVVRE